MRATSRPLPLLLAAALIGGLTGSITLPNAQAQPAGNGGAYIWTYQYKKGTTVRQRGRLDISGEFKQEINGKTETVPLKVTIRSIVKQEVKSVTANGEATVQDTTELYETVVNDQPPVKDMPPPLTRTISKTGQILKQQSRDDKIPSNKTVEAIGLLLNEMIAPEKPVKIGDTWKSELNNRFVDGEKMTLTSTLVGTEKVAGMDALKVKVQMQVLTKAGAGEKETIKLDGVYYVDPKAGRKVRADFDLDNVPLSSEAGNMIVKVSYHVAQIVPGVNDKGDFTDNGGYAESYK